MVKTKAAKRPAKGTFTAEERAAMRELAKERKANLNRQEAEKALLEKIAGMPPSDRAMAKKIHQIVKTTAPELAPRLWYGMPAYTNADGKVVCFFRDADKFKQRYAMLGFEEAAKLDDGSMWPVAFALKKLTPTDEKKIIALVKKAVS